MTTVRMTINNRVCVRFVAELIMGCHFSARVKARDYVGIYLYAYARARFFVMSANFALEAGCISQRGTEREREKVYGVQLLKLMQ